MLKDAPLAACSPGGGAPNCLAPGTYRLTGDVWPGEITMEVPAGWFEWLPYTDHDAYDALLVDAGTDQGSGWGLEFNRGRSGGEGPVRSSEGDLRPSRDRHRRRAGGGDEPMARVRGDGARPDVVGGYSGQLVELTSTRTATDCPNGVGVDDPPGRDRQRVSDGRCDGKARAGTFRIVDVNGTLLVIRTTDFPDTSPNELASGIPDDPTRHAADQVAMQQILDSIAIEPGRPHRPARSRCGRRCRPHTHGGPDRISSRSGPHCMPGERFGLVARR